VGTYTVGWSFGESLELVQDSNDYELAPTLDPNDQAIYAFWTSQSGQELSIKWDKETSDFNLTQYLLKDMDITVERKIDGTPSRLAFSLSHGHMFDPQNISSTWSTILKKGRLLTLKFGREGGWGKLLAATGGVYRSQYFHFL